jgi:outer membrane protein OmpA-like peptidoglycan-associated protein
MLTFRRLVMLCVFFALGGAQAVDVPRLDWSLRTDAPSGKKTIVHGMALDLNGNVIVAGWGDGPLGKSWLVAKYTAKGVPVWQDQYSGDGRWSAAYSVSVDKKGGFVVVGEEKIEGQGKNWVIRRFSPDGTLSWSRTHNNQYNTDDWTQAGIFDSNDDVIVGGGEDQPTGGRVWRIRKYSGKDGAEGWSRMFVGPSQEEDGADINGLAPDRDGYFYAAGFEHSADNGTVWIVRRLNTEGRETWCDRWSSSSVYTDTRADRVFVAKDGSVVVAGHGLVGPWPDYDWLIRRYRQTGETEWTTVITGAGSAADVPRALAPMPEGGILVAGGETEAGGIPVWMALKLDKLGRAQWKMSGIFSKYRCEYANGAAVTDDGSAFYLSGGPASGWMVRNYSSTGGVDVPAAVFKDALFETRSDELSEEAKKLLTKSVEILKADTDIMVRVEGHADERGSDALNFELGLNRANRAVDFMVAGGIPRARMIAQSLGSTAPAVNDYTEQAWRRNRRVHIAAIPMVREK